MAEPKVYTFLNPEPLARSVVLWLYVDMAVSVPFGLSSLLTISETMGADASASKDTPLPSDLIVGVAGLAQAVVSVIVAFLVLKWIYRVSRNAHSAVRGLSISPPWAIGWFFVPIAFLWKPFQGLRETWQVSTQAEGWRAVPTPSLMRWWWGLYLASSFLSQASLRIYLQGGTLGTSAAAAGFDVAAAIVSIPLDLVFIRIVRELTRRQVVEMTFGGAEIGGAD